MGIASTFAVAAKPQSYFAGLYADERPDAPEPVKAAANPPADCPDTHALFVTGEKLLCVARRSCQSLALLVLEFPDLAELEVVFGHQAVDAAVHAVMRELSSLAGSKGFAARTSADTFALLMPLITGTTLHRALRARTGPACCAEFEFGEYDIVLVPDVQAGTVAATDSVEKTYLVLRRTIASGRHIEEMRNDCRWPGRNAPSAHIARLPNREAATPLHSPYVTIPATMVMPTAPTECASAGFLHD